VPLAALEDARSEDIAARLLPPERALAALRRIDLDAEGAADFVNGREVKGAADVGNDRDAKGTADVVDGHETQGATGVAPELSGAAADAVPVCVYGVVGSSAAAGLLGIGLMNSKGTIKPHKVLYLKK
jgi:hypothetical protein